jgi:hypothetical protein
MFHRSWVSSSCRHVGGRELGGEARAVPAFCRAWTFALLPLGELLHRFQPYTFQHR